MKKAYGYLRLRHSHQRHLAVTHKATDVICWTFYHELEALIKI
jgi:hypothetical protein